MGVILEKGGDFSGINLGKKVKFIMGEETGAVFSEQQFFAGEDVHVGFKSLINTYIKGLIG